MEISQNSNQESNLTRRKMEISQNSNQESNLTRLQNITQLVSRIKFKKIAKYHTIQV